MLMCLCTSYDSFIGISTITSSMTCLLLILFSVRCSTMPLVSNHYYQILTSWEGFVVSLASPSGNAANGDISLGSITYRLHQVGRRYQSPPLLNSFLLVVATASLGAFVGHIVMPYWEMVQPGQHDSHATQSAWFLIYFTTALTVIFHLGLSLRGQHSHELNPKRYYEHNNKRGSLPVVSLFFEKIWSIGASTVVVPAISFFSASIYNGDYQHYGKLELAAMIFKELGVLLILCVTTAACVGFYTAGINEAVKHVLCTPGSRLQRFVREVTCGRAPNSPDGGESSITYEQEDAYVVDAMLHSLLHRELALVTQISKSTASGNPNYIKLEEYEAERNEQAITAVAKSLLTTTKDSCEAPLEEDILRHSILESLGGSKLNSSSSPAAVSPGMSNGVFEEFPVDMHHQETIQYWIQPPSNTINLQRRTNATATSVEPKGVPLVRALCAFSGGLGQALIDCSKPQSPYISWEFPPGAIAAAEYATVALARCIAYNLKHSNQNAADWRSTHISMFIPAALTSAYRLHLGILEFAQYRIKVKRSWNLGPDKMQQRQMMGYDRSAMDTGAIIDEIARETPELMKILRACNASVKIIRRELLASQGSGQSMRIIENSVGKDCACWVQQIMSQQH